MKAAGTDLETLIVHQISFPLVQYLSSFSGLRILKIHDIERRYTSSPLDILSSFLDKALSSHAHSLGELAVEWARMTESIPAWSFDPSTWGPSISNLRRLKFLSIHPPVVFQDNKLLPTTPLLATDLSLNSAIQHTTLLTQSYRTLFESLAGHPSLDTLQILCPRIRYGEYEWDREWEEWIGGIVDVVMKEEVRSMGLTKGIPRVVVKSERSRREYAACQGKEGLDWMYEHVVTVPLPFNG